MWAMKYRVAEISGILPIFHRILETTFRNTSQQKLGEKTSNASKIIPKLVPPLALWWFWEVLQYPCGR